MTSYASYYNGSGTGSRRSSGGLPYGLGELSFGRGPIFGQGNSGQAGLAGGYNVGQYSAGMSPPRSSFGTYAPPQTLRASAGSGAGAGGVQQGGNPMFGYMKWLADRKKSLQGGDSSYEAYQQENGSGSDRIAYGGGGSPAPQPLAAAPPQAHGYGNRVTY